MAHSIRTVYVVHHSHTDIGPILPLRLPKVKMKIMLFLCILQLAPPEAPRRRGLILGGRSGMLTPAAMAAITYHSAGCAE